MKINSVRLFMVSFPPQQNKKELDEWIWGEETNLFQN